MKTEPSSEAKASPDKIRVRFNTSISSMDGSYALGQEAKIEAYLARAWAKSGTVTPLEKIPEETEEDIAHRESLGKDAGVPLRPVVGDTTYSHHVEPRVPPVAEIVDPAGRKPGPDPTHPVEAGDEGGDEGEGEDAPTKSAKPAKAKPAKKK